jgi:hypothetical protein
LKPDVLLNAIGLAVFDEQGKVRPNVRTRFRVEEGRCQRPKRQHLMIIMVKVGEDWWVAFRAPKGAPADHPAGWRYTWLSDEHGAGYTEMTCHCGRTRRFDVAIQQILGAMP